jgi:hypothetical protein
MPSLDVVREATVNKNGKHAGKYTVVLTNGSRPRPRFAKWQNAFEPLRMEATSVHLVR